MTSGVRLYQDDDGYLWVVVDDKPYRYWPSKARLEYFDWIDTVEKIAIDCGGPSREVCFEDGHRFRYTRH